MLSLNPLAWRALAVLVILAPGSARAQMVASSFEDLRKALKNGQAVVVTGTNGQRNKGTVTDVSPSTLVILIGDSRTRTFDAGTIVEIRGPDTLRSGALTGLGAGAGAGFAMVAAMCADGPDCGPSIQVVGIAAGIGAAIGAGIDALLSNRGRVLYRSRQQTFRLTISPLAGAHRQGVMASVRF